jgi:dTDP-4-dehydrorhamnose reductase
MRVLIVGATGQLGRALVQTVPNNVQSLTALSSSQLDITNSAQVQWQIDQLRPNVILNAAAYTAVDQAQRDSVRAFSVNRDGAQVLAEAARKYGARLLHVSTDFVFDGTLGRAYRPEDEPAPLSVYGKSKLQGEKAILLAHAENSLIIRTAWVYSAYGHNFVNTVLRLQRERDVLHIVSDQLGTPTWSSSLARCLWVFANRNETGVLHYTDAGVASWYDLAIAVSEEALALGIISQMKPVLPIESKNFPLPAPRPACAVLNKFTTWSITGVPAHWRANLREMLKQLK